MIINLSFPIAESERFFASILPYRLYIPVENGGDMRRKQRGIFELSFLKMPPLQIHSTKR